MINLKRGNEGKTDKIKIQINISKGMQADQIDNML